MFICPVFIVDAEPPFIFAFSQLPSITIEEAPVKSALRLDAITLPLNLDAEAAEIENILQLKIPSTDDADDNSINT